MKMTTVFLILFSLVSNPLFSASKNEIVKVKPVVLTLKKYLRLAIKNNPLVKRVSSDYASQQSTLLRTAALKDFFLSASSYFSSISGSGVTSWGLNSSLTKAFPTLGGMTASLNLNYGLSTSSYSGTSPSLGLTVMLPLLYNSLGLIDRGVLKIMSINLEILDKTKKELFEIFLLTLYNGYYDWVLSTKKTNLYRGFMGRAWKLYNQTLKKRRYGIADLADTQLSLYNYQNYKTLYEMELLKAKQAYLFMLSMMVTKKTLKKLPVYIPAHKISAKIPAIKREINLADMRVVQTAQLSLKSGGIQLQSDTNGAHPSLDLVVKASRDGSQVPSAFSFSSFDQTEVYAGVEFSFSLQNSDARHKLDAAVHQLVKLQKEYEELIIGFSFSMRKYLTEIKSSLKIAALKQKLASIAGKQVRANYAKYKLGRSTLNQLSDSYNSQARARIDYLEYCIVLQKKALEYMALTDQLDLSLFKQ